MTSTQGDLQAPWTGSASFSSPSDLPALSMPPTAALVTVPAVESHPSADLPPLPGLRAVAQAFGRHRAVGLAIIAFASALILAVLMGMRPALVEHLRQLRRAATS